MKSFKVILMGTLLAGIVSFPVAAEEKIISFDSDIVVEKSGALLVTETIDVIAEGAEIKRGIYRDFPTKYKTESGLNYRVSFDVVDVKRNGAEEPWFTNVIANGTRVYIGKKNIYIPAGRHTYTLTYRTKGQVGYFTDHDEIFWNVTGNGWIFPIESASCRVRLPDGVYKETIKTGGFTGASGSRAKNFRSSVLQDNTVVFNATVPLGSHEGLTILVAFNKGVLVEPTPLERVLGKIYDNLGILLMVVSFVVILGYYFIFWFRYGIDPKKGAIAPRFEPPRGVSAAGMRYLTNMRFDNKTLAVALVSMAVKGYLTITKEDKDYGVIGKNQDEALLSADEKVLAKNLPHLDKGFTFVNKSVTIIKRLFADFQAELGKEYENKYFITNYKYIVPGIIISISCVIVTGIFDALVSGSVSMFAFMALWLGLWTVGVIALGTAVVSAWKGVSGTSGFGGAIFITLFSVPFYAGEVAGCYMMAQATSVYFLVFFLSAIALNALFYYLLKAPTDIGRKAMDEMEGFKLFLTVSEKESIDYSIKINKAVYEKFLPYAMALDVEKKWSDKFVSAISATGDGDTLYKPGWYYGSAFGHGFIAGSFASDFSTSFNSSVASSAVAPGSSSGFSGGGGGGGSGGGGGGGGGGGW